MRILVTGGNGFLGRSLIEALRTEYTVASLTRSDASSKDVPTYRFSSLTDDALDEAAKNADVIIHTAAQLHGPQSEMEQANVAFTARLAELSKKYNHRKFVYVSTENVTQGNTDIYSRTKQLGEEQTRILSNVLIVRPTIIYGPGDTKYIGRLRNIILRYPVVPVLGNGKQLFQFVFVKDLIAVIRNGIHLNIQGTYTIAGPDCISYNNLMKELMEVTGKKRMLLHLPIWMLRLLSSVLNMIFKNPPLTPTQLDNLAKDRKYDISENVKIFAYTPTPLRKGLEQI